MHRIVANPATFRSVLALAYTNLALLMTVLGECGWGGDERDELDPRS